MRNKLGSIPKQSTLLYIWGTIWLLISLVSLYPFIPVWFVDLGLIVGTILTIIMMRGSKGGIEEDKRTPFHRNVAIGIFIAEILLIVCLVIVLKGLPASLISTVIALVIGAHFIPYGFVFHREYFFTSIWIIASALGSWVWFKDDFLLFLGPGVAIGLLFTGLLIQIKNKD